jgi:ATP-dependent Clp protease protease subunit
MAKVNRDHIDKFFDYGLDLDSRTLYIGSVGYDENDEGTGVDFKMAERVIKGLHLLEVSAPAGDKPIYIKMENVGGSVTSGMGIYDAIKNCKNHVTITVYGEACSMGCIILQAADKRILSKHAVTMFHRGYSSYPTNHPEINRRWVEFDEKYKLLLEKILLDKIREKHPDFREKKLVELNLFDSIYLPQDAIDLGLADAILE